MSKGWWFDRHSYDHRDYSYDKGSGSRGWMSKLGSWYDDDDYYRPSKTDANRAFQNLLNQLQNSANLLGSDAEGGAVRVCWSNGQNVNLQSEDRTIFLSPDNVLDGKNAVSDEKLDAMTGKVYLASMLRETVDPNAYGMAQAYRGSKGLGGSAVRLWEAVETSIARTQLLDDWAGFGPYIAEDARASSATKEQVQEFIDASVMNPNVESALTAIAWNLLNSSDPVRVPDVYDKCVEVASEALADEVEASDRFRVCHDIAQQIEKILHEAKTAPEKGDGDPDSSSKSDGSDGDSSPSGSDGDSDSESSDSGDSEEEGEESDRESGSGSSAGGKGKPSKPSKKPGKPGEAPKVCDDSMLGANVDNKVNAELAKQIAEDKSESSSGGDIDVLTADSRMDQTGKHFSFVSVRANGDQDAKYRMIVNDHRRAIQMVRSSLMFRNADASMVSYGHRRGDIDENSLFKVGMGDDRVMCVRDAVSDKKIAVCLLVDESGSMGSGRGSKSEMSRNVAIVLAEGLKGIAGISVDIYGHSAEINGEDGKFCYGAVMMEYVSPRKSDIASCMNITGRGENHDGHAIQHTANRFLRDHADASRKIMFVISDGQPAGSCYGGLKAVSHVLNVSEACRSRGLEVYGIGVLNAFSMEVANRLYGKDRCVVLADVESSLGVMTRFLRQVASRVR